ncbi:hypothetical protein BH09ACT4_BH09ACT4_15670 [soil metagenome]
MMLFEEPPIVDLHEILDEQEAHEAHATRAQWALVVVGGIVGIAGLLAVLVVTAPALLDVASWINSIWKAATPG